MKALEEMKQGKKQKQIFYHFLSKQFQSEVNAGQLVNQDNVRRMISDDQIFASFKNIRGLKFLNS